MDKKNFSKEYKYTVCTRCFTYNQETYIKDAMDGFIMQQTTFPVVNVIVDDKSTDNTKDVIIQYMKEQFVLDAPEAYEKETDYAFIIFAPHHFNKHCWFAIVFLKENHYRQGKDKFLYLAQWMENAKYHAICEGDDYWIDKDKLQKQVDFMESHTNYALVHSRYNYFYENNNSYESDDLEHRSIISIIKKEQDVRFYILDSNKYRIQTVTVLIRKESYDRISSCLNNEHGLFMMGDTQLWMNLISVGKIKYLPMVTSVYRVNNGSVSKPKAKNERLHFALSCEEMRYYYAKKNNISLSHFYYRYLIALFKYLIYNPHYETNPRIIRFDDHCFLIRVILRSNIFKLLTRVVNQ